MTFGSSSLKRIGTQCFMGTEIEEVTIPDSVRELYDKCFFRFSSLRHVGFSPSSSLERIGFRAFPRNLYLSDQ